MPNLVKGGFRVWGTLSGGQGNFPGTKTQEVANNNAAAIFNGDIIIPVTDGTIAVGAAANNGLLLGVAVGFSYVISGRREPMPCLPANTTFTPSTVGSTTASYVDYIPLTGDVILEVDANAAPPAPGTVASALGLIGKNGDIVSGVGDLTTGVSAMTLNLATATTTTFNFRIIGVTEYPHLTNNDLTLTRAKYLVICNEGFLPPYTPVGV